MGLKPFWIKKNDTVHKVGGVAIPAHYPASKITYDNTDSGLVATDAQDAIDELNDAIDEINDTSVTPVSGNPISISGLKSNQLAIDPIITFEPIQAGSGTPSPSNVRAISGYDKVEVLSCGKNIFDGSVYDGKRWTSQGLSNYSNWYASILIPVKGGESNYISSVVYRYYYDKDFNPISEDNTGYAVVTTPANARWMGISQAKADWTTPSTTMVAISDTAIDYEPCNKTTSISESLGQTVYKGSLDIRTGLLTVTHGIADLGDFTYIYNAGGTGEYGAPLPLAKLVSTISNPNAVCSIYAVREDGYKYADNFTIGVADRSFNDNPYITIKDNRYTSASDLKTALTGQKLVYELATPIEIQLTPHEISLLKDYAYISTNGTSMSFSYHNGEIASLADVSQLGETVNELGDKFKTPIRYSNGHCYKIGKIVYFNFRENVTFSSSANTIVLSDIPAPSSVYGTQLVFITIANNGYVSYSCQLGVNYDGNKWNLIGIVFDNNGALSITVTVNLMGLSYIAE